MENRLIHIVPFDLGNSFMDFEYNKKVNKDEFLNRIKQQNKLNGFKEINDVNDKIMLITKLSPNIKCYLLSYGVGIFVIENLDFSIEAKFDERPACQLYYHKKFAQKEILELKHEKLKCMKLFMEMIWSELPNKNRNVTANPHYKHQGLSYVLTIYCLNHNKYNEMKKDIDLLMNPEIMSNILNKDEWPLIKHNVDNYTEIGHHSINFSSKSKVVSSWSGVLVMDDQECKCLEKVIEYEIILQGAWFLYDSLIDTLKSTSQTNIQLQRMRSLVSYVSMEISNITSANMSTNEIKVFNKIYSTSGILIVENKLNKLLENRINIEDAKHKIKQTNYGIITEILLVLFTIINLFGPVKAIIDNELNSKDIFIIVIMLLALIICSILIIRKEK